ncbi:MAG: tetratricopeptide repeat protein [Reyranellaceae bacterium]
MRGLIVAMNRKQRRAQQKQGSVSPANALSPAHDRLAEALSHHQAGRLAEAEKLYRQILAADPRQSGALHLLGVLAHQVGRHDVAVELIGRAIAIKGDNPDYHGHLGIVLRHLGRFDEAVASYDRALVLRPDNAETHSNRGVALQAQGRLDEAVASYDRALVLQPDYADSANHRGSALSAQGRHDEALASFDRALAVRADYAEAHTNRGMVLVAQDKPAEAVRSFDRALALRPGYAEAHVNRGIALMAMGELGEAVLSYDRALAANPDLAVAHNNRGNALHQQGCLDEALASYDRALAINPGSAEIHDNRGNTLRDLGRVEEALACYGQALALRRDFPGAHVSTGNLLRNLGRLGEAVASYDRALALEADDAEIHASRGVALAGQGELDAAVESFDRARVLDPGSLRYAWLSKLWLPIIPASSSALAAQRVRYRDGIDALQQFPGSLPPPETINLPSAFYLAYHNVDDLDDLRAFCRLYRTKAPQLCFEAPYIRHWQAPSHGRRIRIGFLSEFLGDHTIGRLYGGLLRHLDRSRFEVVVIHAPRAPRDVMSDQFDRLADKAIRLPTTLGQQQQAVAAESLDLLFYPDIGMSKDTYLLAHARLAPIQAVSWGHPSTTGLDTIDYFVSADSIETADADRYYGERLIRLERLPCFYEMSSAAPEALGRVELGLPAAGTLYACPQSLFKFHPDFDAILAEIASGDPRGHIVLLDSIQPAWSRLLRERWAASHPVLLERVRFVPRQRHARFLALMSHFDVLLDPIHFGSGNTLYEAMIYGTPIVTWPGRFMRGRIVAGAYHQMRLADAPVAARLEDYAPLALALGSDPTRRAALRHAARAKAGELFADRKAVQQFESFLEAAVAAAGRKETLPLGWRPGSLLP